MAMFSRMVKKNMLCCIPVPQIVVWFVMFREFILAIFGADELWCTLAFEDRDKRYAAGVALSKQERKV